jgi:hypothetical protein
VAALAVAMCVAAAPAEAKILKFHAVLDGKNDYAKTGSEATGRAKVRVDTDRKRVSVDLDVDGISAPQLWANLVQKPIGPIHFHLYHPDGSAVLVLPLPYGPNYHTLPHGLHVKMVDYDYATGAKLLNSTLPFDDFVAAMKSGTVILNVHTDKFNQGEIAGKVIED